jgi:hypothetical protein
MLMSRFLNRPSFIVQLLFSLAIGAASGSAAAQTDYAPKSGQPGKDVV